MSIHHLKFKRLRRCLGTLRRWYLIDRNLPPGSFIHSSATIDKTASVGGLLRLFSNVSIGLYTFITGTDPFGVEIGSNTTIHSFGIINGDIVIGSNCLIGPRVTVLSGTHLIDTQDLIRNQDAAYFNLHSSYPSRQVVIGDDCWLGANSVVLPGVTLGNGCVVGANSVVTKSFSDYSVVAGSPARLLRMRQ